MYAALLLIVTAVGEAGTGLALLLVPSLALALLFGNDGAAPETLLVARVAGAALLAVGVLAWPARGMSGDPGPRVLVGVLLYDVSAAVLLSHAGLVLPRHGPALWPAVGVHAALAGWSVLCLAPGQRRANGG